MRHRNVNMLAYRVYLAYLVGDRWKTTNVCVVARGAKEAETIALEHMREEDEAYCPPCRDYEVIDTIEIGFIDRMQVVEENDGKE